MRGEVVEVAALPRQAVNADDDVLRVRRPPFDIGRLVEAGGRQPEKVAAALGLELARGLP
jgi:hypothetical protein